MVRGFIGDVNRSRRLIVTNCSFWGDSGMLGLVVTNHTNLRFCTGQPFFGQYNGTLCGREVPCLFQDNPSG